MACPICDNKPPNCDCTELEQWQHEEIERLVAELERHRMTAEERGMAASAVDFMSEPGVDPEPLAMLAEINVLRGYLDRTAPKEVGRE